MGSAAVADLGFNSCRPGKLAIGKNPFTEVKNIAKPLKHLSFKPSEPPADLEWLPIMESKAESPNQRRFGHFHLHYPFGQRRPLIQSATYVSTVRDRTATDKSG